MLQRPRRNVLANRFNVVLMAVCLVACSGAGAPSDSRADPTVPTGPRAPACSEALLLDFDPGSPVLERRLLPPALQRADESQQHIVETACDEQESDASCKSRSAKGARADHPDAKLATSIVHEQHILRARYELDGAPVEATFDDSDELAEHLLALQAAGRTVTLLRGESIPAPDSPRYALTRATTHATLSSHQVLRIELLTQPQDSHSVAALLRVQQRAMRAGLQLHMWDPLPEGRFRFELGCSKPSEP